MTTITRLFDFAYYELEKYNLADALVTKQNGVWKKTSSQEYVDNANKISRENFSTTLLYIRRNIIQRNNLRLFTIDFNLSHTFLSVVVHVTIFFEFSTIGSIEPKMVFTVIFFKKFFTKKVY